ncbi:MAG: hypothetical protein A2293_12795 [Elusimicrobia bacterium RIFOXYB2_FULL_49_7]|nr:MAG: hypothetical protein A2293_12795 [Elusimicrobia bacterium RIFOXYB2_FULL_49_7]
MVAIVRPTILFVIGFLFLSCADKNPLVNNPQTGSVSPKILYKTAGNQSSITLPAAIANRAARVQLMVQWGQNQKTEKTVPYGAHQISLENIPIGEALLIFNVKDADNFTIYHGETHVTIQADIQIKPIIMAEPVPAVAPALTAIQICDIKVRLEWPPCGLADRYRISIESGSPGNWYPENSFEVREGEGVRYDEVKQKFYIIDSLMAYMTDMSYRFQITAIFGLNLESDLSNWAPLTIQTLGVACNTIPLNRYRFAGLVLGAITTETHINIFTDNGTGMPDSMPSYAPTYSWIMKEHGDSMQFDFGTLPEGDYWIYIYDGYYIDNTNWSTAKKINSYTLPLNRDWNDALLQLQFSPILYGTGNNLAGTLTGGTSSYQYASLYYYNDDSDSAYALGDYFSDMAAGFLISNVPTLSQMASLFGVYSDPTYDGFELFLMSDEDNNMNLSAGDRYYWDSVTEFYWAGEVLGPTNLGSIYLNETAVEPSGKIRILAKPAPAVAGLARAVPGQ